VSTIQAYKPNRMFVKWHNKNPFIDPCIMKIEIPKGPHHSVSQMVAYPDGSKVFSMLNDGELRISKRKRKRKIEIPNMQYPKRKRQQRTWQKVCRKPEIYRQICLFFFFKIFLCIIIYIIIFCCVNCRSLL
jgi:hypothetical protein